MTPRWLVALFIAAPAGALLPACVAQPVAVSTPAPAPTASHDLVAAVDRLLDVAPLNRATTAVHIESLADGRVIYSRSADTRVMPASALKLVTAAVAAERLGWAYRFETRLETSGPIVDGVLHGDVIVVGSGDPTINAQDLRTAPLFESWGRSLREAGVTEVAGRLVGDVQAFVEEPLGAGWAWDYLTDTYAAPSGALSYNENLVAVRIRAGDKPGDPASVILAPVGHGLLVENEITTSAPGGSASVSFERLPASSSLTVKGRIPAGSPDVVRATTVTDPTMFFLGGLRAALVAQGIRVTGESIARGTAADGPSDERQLVAIHRSLPLSSIVAQMLKVSQNYYAEMLIKAIGRTASDAGRVGSTASGQRVVREVLEEWKLPVDSLVMYDGSGLSRYNYASARLLTDVLRRMWNDPRHRGPFVAALPVAGHDGTLGSRMTDALGRRVQAKTGTIANVRSLAGYGQTANGDRIVFAMIANHFVAPNAEIDRVMEGVLEEVLLGPAGGQ